MINLPQNLISYALSLSSPGDVCRAAAVSKAFRSAASSDTLWNRFLPPDLDESSHGRSIQGRPRRESSSTSYSAIPSSSTIATAPPTIPCNWFEKVAQLLEVYWLLIIGRISCRMLSPNTRYAAYLVFKLVPNETKGLAFPSQEVSVTLGDCVSKSAVCLDIASGEVASNVLQLPRERADTWREIEMGQFFNVMGDERTVTMILRQTLTMNEKRGLIIEGIEVRPKA